MAAFPDFSAHGYQVIKELGHNLEGGRFTYLAIRLADNVDVVIKQFQFSKGSGWDGFRAIEREIQSLQGLNHRGIPKYLDKFETDNGYCLVTEYFPADTLAVGRSFTPDQIKQIAVQLLEILVSLQERMPPVIHRDVKPENILLDDNLNVYLIDFGFARVGSGSVAMSSANAGTFGFMAPEQIRNLKLTNASDLYGLGLTLICLIGAIRSTDIGNYIDFSNQLDRSKIDPKLKGCSLTFVKWLDQMVAPDPSKRFADAKNALESLQPLYVVRVPEVKFFKEGKEFDPSKDVLEFKATKLGEKLTQTITLVNSIPETILEGHWEVAPHPNDPPHSPDNHAWISFSKKKFEGNRVNCEILVDTSRLIAQAKGKRELLLKINTNQRNYSVLVKVETAVLTFLSQSSEESFSSTSIIAIVLGAGLPVVMVVLLSYLRDFGVGCIVVSTIMSIGICLFANKELPRNLFFSSFPFFLLLAFVTVGNLIVGRPVAFLQLLSWSIGWLSGTIFGISILWTFAKFVVDVPEILKTKKFSSILIYLFGTLLGLVFLILSNTNSYIQETLSVPNNPFMIESSNMRNMILFAVDFLKSIKIFIFTVTAFNGIWLIYLFFLKQKLQIRAYRRKEEHLIKL
jgi:serine/threonine protein kinase